MKSLFIICIFYLPLSVVGQEIRSIAEVEGRSSLSMGEVAGKTSDGVYRYYATGENQPFTGILYAKDKNGTITSWQEYEDGVGEGSWINYYSNGNYKEVGTYRQNKVEGPIKKYYENGKLKAAGTYKDWRIKVGVWKFYNLLGELTKVVDYGQKGNIDDVQAYYDRGEISYAWYARILKDNGFSQ